MVAISKFYLHTVMKRTVMQTRVTPGRELGNVTGIVSLNHTHPTILISTGELNQIPCAFCSEQPGLNTDSICMYSHHATGC
jgi:hypothetical protein